MQGTEVSDLERFVVAQNPVYERVIDELRHGRKETHWIWFIFPQIRGLGTSEKSRFYAIQGIQEAREYLNHPVLGRRLLECAEILLECGKDKRIGEILEDDSRKLKSSMTLFSRVSPPGSVFERVLTRFFDGSDEETDRILREQWQART